MTENSTRNRSNSSNLFLAKAIFFSNSLSSVGWSRFQNNFYLDHGLTSFDIGSLKSIGLILKVFGEPFWSFVADLTDPKAVFVFCMFVQIVTLEILRRARPLTFNLILFIKIFRTVTATNTTLATTASFKLTDGSNEGYGRQRMFGSLAWGIGAFTTGLLIDYFGMDFLFFFTYIFIFINFLLVIFGYPSTRRKLAIHSKSDDTLRGASGKAQFLSHFNVTQIYLEMRQYFASPPCRVILCNAFGYGAVMSVIDTYLYISLEVDFHVSRTYSGCCTAASILSCLPIFWYSDWLIREFGHFNMILLAQLSCLARLLVYGLLPINSHSSLQIILILQVFHGVSFALYWSAAVDAVYKLAPRTLTSSCLATLNVMYFTLSGAIGNYLFGWLYSSSGRVQWVYMVAAYINLVLVLLFRRNEGVLTLGLSVYDYDASNEPARTDIVTKSFESESSAKSVPSPMHNNMNNKSDSPNSRSSSSILTTGAHRSSGKSKPFSDDKSSALR